MRISIYLISIVTAIISSAVLSVVSALVCYIPDFLQGAFVTLLCFIACDRYRKKQPIKNQDQCEESSATN